jgi:hypothetical protein
MVEFNSSDQGGLEKLENAFNSLKSPIEEVFDSIGQMIDETEKLNNAFLQGRTRLDEMADAVSRSAAGVIRLGGSISDVSNTIIKISEGSRRNVIDTEEQVSKLFAASRMLGKDANTLVSSFAEVGYETSQIGPNLENSIEYVQSVGLNAKTVVRDVAENMELMNRFNFSDGVQGLTKMAAQASMLRFEMQNTANFADKVMSPEGAIEAAAGFQRLGVNIGGLVDPFKLMNDSINDPGALQDSIIKATKQYTEFDEKTKSFKINPQGILMLKELSDVTGITTKELSKTALAAADLDRRVSSISPSLNFEKPEDKQLLANMATMKDGEYVVQIKDDQGAIEYKKLGDITAEEFKELRKKQDEAPKTLEEIQISQLDYLKNIESFLKGNLAKLTFGVAGTSVVRGNLTGADRITRSITSSVDKNLVPESSKVTETINKGISKVYELFNQKESGKISDSDFTSKVTKLVEEIKNKVGDKGGEMIKGFLNDSGKKVTGDSFLEKKFQGYQTDFLTSIGEVRDKYNKTSMVQKIEPLTTNQILGKRKDLTTTYSETKSTNINGQIDVGGTINIKVEAPAGVSEKDFKIFFDSPEFKRKVYEYYEEKAKELERR